MLCLKLLDSPLGLTMALAACTRSIHLLVRIVKAGSDVSEDAAAENLLSSRCILVICGPGITIRPTYLEVISAFEGLPVDAACARAVASAALEGMRYSNELPRIILLSLSVHLKTPVNKRPSRTVTCRVLPSNDSRNANASASAISVCDMVVLTFALSNQQPSAGDDIPSQ